MSKKSNNRKFLEYLYSWQYIAILNWLLWPVSLLYYLGHLCNFHIIQRLKRIDFSSKVNVICVGNLTVGGSGKTPTTISLAQHLKNLGYNIAIISRGYGGKLSASSQATLVDSEKHQAYEVGDEPLLLSKIAPTYINKNRVLAAQQALQDIPQPDFIIMDDGMQNNTISKDLNITLFDSSYGIGNGMLLPAGPLRQTLKSGLYNTDIIILVDNNKSKNPALSKILSSKCKNKLILTATPKYTIPKIAIQQQNAILLTGIARPDRVRMLLEQEGIVVAKHYEFADHYDFKESQLLKIIDNSKKNKLPILTTEKDFERIPKRLQSHFFVIKYQLHIDWSQIGLLQ